MKIFTLVLLLLTVWSLSTPTTLWANDCTDACNQQYQLDQDICLNENDICDCDQAYYMASDEAEWALTECLDSCSGDPGCEDECQAVYYQAINDAQISHDNCYAETLAGLSICVAAAEQDFDDCNDACETSSASDQSSGGPSYAYPNPFNPSTTITFYLENSGAVRLEIFDVKGNRVRILMDGSMGHGRQHVMWSGCDDAGNFLPSGIYYYRLQTKDTVETRCLTLLK